MTVSCGGDKCWEREGGAKLSTLEKIEWNLSKIWSILNRWILTFTPYVVNNKLNPSSPETNNF